MNDEARIDLGRNLHTWEKSVLEEGDLFLVGGNVRDLLLEPGGESLDQDYLVTGLAYDRLVAILGRVGKTNLVGKSFGVVKFDAPGGGTVDISLPRTEYSTGPKHKDFSVTYDPTLPVETDLSRRDFTINSMAVHLGSMQLIDPLGGARDLDARILRMNRPEAFTEDPLRILRGVQFLARFKLTVDGRTLELMRRDGELLLTVSGERIRDELGKMLVLAEHPGDGFLFMHDNGILTYVLPELEETYGIEQNEYHPDDIFFHSIRTCNEVRPELHLRWSALLHDLGKREKKKMHEGRIVFYRHEEESVAIAEAIFERLHFPNALAKRVTHLIRHHMFHITDEWSEAALRRFISRIGEEHLEDLLALREADLRSRKDEDVKKYLQTIKERLHGVIEASTALRKEQLAINGSDIMKILSIESGPEVGEVLTHLLEMVIDDPGLNERSTLIGIVEGMKKNKM
jgi:tRNA nucleotidyltransferase (CCA-adding enzyme)